MFGEKDEYLRKKRAQYAKFRFSTKGLIIFLCILIVLGFTGFIKESYSKAVNGLFGYDSWRKSISQNDLQVHMIDVGQGDAIAIRLPDGKTMLIDAGPRKSSDKLETYLKNVFFNGGDCVFDYVILTHSDSDHCGGMPAVYDLCKVKLSLRPITYSTASDYEEGVNEMNVLESYNEYYADYIDCIYNEPASDVIYLNRGLNYTYYPKGYFTGSSTENPSQKYSITFLTNNRYDYDEANETSAVVYLEYAGRSMLFTGDAESQGFEEIETAMGTLLIENITLYKASHHGSSLNGCNNATTLFTLNPEYVAISVGKKNAYGHPSEDFMDTLYVLGVPDDKILRTDKDGSCIFGVSLNGNSALGDFIVCSNIPHKKFIPYAWEFTYLFVMILVAIPCFYNYERIKREDLTDN